jgi:O-antigen ligase
MLLFLKKNFDLIFLLTISFLPFIALGNIFLFLTFFLFLAFGEKISSIDFQSSFLILYIIFSTFSIVFSQDFYRSLQEGKEILNFLIYFLSLIYFSKKIKNENLIFAFLIPSLFLSSYGIIEFFVKGLNDKNYRIHSLLSHYMTYTGILLIYFAILISYSFLSGNKKYKKFTIFGASLTIPPMFLSLTRNAWIGLFSILFFLLLFFKKRFLIFLFLIPLIFILIFPSTIGKRVFSIFDLKDKTNIDRIKMWKASFNIFLKKPITGFGLGIPQKDYIFFREEGAIRYRIPHFHSNLFQILPERGIFASLSYLGFVIFSLINGYKRRYNWRGLATFLSVFAISVAGFFEFNFGDTEILWLTLISSNLWREADEDI